MIFAGPSPYIGAALAAREMAIRQHNYELAMDASMQNMLVGQRRQSCPYCHRTDQKPGRTSCDGCGAPR